MIGVDTNVLLRFLVEDDNAEQRQAALRFMATRNAADPAFVNLVTLAETVWVLRKRLRFPLRQVREAFSLLLASSDFVFEEHDRLTGLMGSAAETGCDVADYLIAWANQRAGCTATVTFDRAAAAHVPGMELLA